MGLHHHRNNPSWQPDHTSIISSIISNHHTLEEGEWYMLSLLLLRCLIPYRCNNSILVMLVVPLCSFKVLLHLPLLLTTTTNPIQR